MLSKYTPEEISRILVKVKLQRSLKEQERLTQAHIDTAISLLEAIQQELAGLHVAEHEDELYDAIILATNKVE